MEFHKQKGISNSAMGYLCPEQSGSIFKYKKAYIDGEREDSVGPHLEFGKQIHKFIEDPDSFHISDVDKPSAMMGRLVDAVNDHHLFGELDGEILKQARANNWYKTMKDDTLLKKFHKEGTEYLQLLKIGTEKTVLTSNQKSLLERCVANLQANPSTNEALFGVVADGCERFKELELFWKEGCTGSEMDCKGMIDICDINHTRKHVIITDFKTTGKSLGEYPRAFEYWRTYRQLAYYGYGLMCMRPELVNYTFEYRVIAVETATSINEARMFEIQSAWILEGIKEYLKYLKLIAEGRRCNWSNDFMFAPTKLDMI